MPKTVTPQGDKWVKNQRIHGLYAVGGTDSAGRSYGLHLQVKVNGQGIVSRSWIARLTVGYRINEQGKKVQVRRDMGLGRYPDVPLAEAREKAQEAYKLARTGHDPILAREAEKLAAQSAQQAARAMALTFDDCAREYIDKKSVEFKNAKHIQQWRNTLATYASPVIGPLLVRDIQLAHITKILERDNLWIKKTETATRVRQRLEDVLGYATVRGYRTGDNPARWKGHLDKVFPSPAKLKNVEHHPALQRKDLGKFVADLRARGNVSGWAVEFLLLTGVRTGELIGATRDEVDMDARCWTIPGARRKTGAPLRVPLSEPAIRILNTLPKPSKGDWLFPGQRKDGALSDGAMAELLKGMPYVDKGGNKITPHGMRSLLRDWCADTGVPHDVSEAILGHAEKSKTVAAYLRSDLYDRRLPVMDAWAEVVETACAGAGQ